MTFDSPTFARRLKAAGFSEAQAEALADANRDLLVSELASKRDIESSRVETKSDSTSIRGDMVAMEQRLEARIEALGLRLTIRLGVLIGTAVALLAAILRLH